jgi:type II secretory pathway predicted ATPase ExeA
MYETFFGLSANPFRLQPDPRFFFWSRGHQSVHGGLHLALDKGEAFIVLTGEIGAGKTTLAHLLLSGIDPSLTTVVHLVSTQFDGANFLQALHIAFDLPPRRPGAQPRTAREELGELEAHLLNLDRRGMKAALVIDEAQSLSADALNELFTLAMMLRERDSKVLQCVLMGQPELSTRLEQLAQRRLGLPAAAAFHLGRIEKDELSSYVEHRLSVVGWKHNPRFESGAYEILFTATDGIPRRVNSLCNRLLLGAQLAGKRRISRGDVEQTAAELRDELGVDALPSMRTIVAGRTGNAAMERAAVQSLHVSSVAARLDRLERHVTTLLKNVQLYVQNRLENARQVRLAQPAVPVTRSGWRK